jgi:hypothetical protein
LEPVQLLEWICTWPGAVLLRGSGTAWLLVNAAHIFGVGLLVGAIVPLDLHLLGLFSRLATRPDRALPVAHRRGGRDLGVRHQPGTEGQCAAKRIRLYG